MSSQRAVSVLKAVSRLRKIQMAILFMHLLDAAHGTKPSLVCWRLLEDGKTILNALFEPFIKALVAPLIIKQP